MSNHWLTVRRNELKLSQLEFAERINRAQSSISMWENGAEIPLLCNPDDAKYFADALELSIYEMYTRAGFNMDNPEISESQNMVRRIQALPEVNRRFVLRLLDVVLNELPD